MQITLTFRLFNVMLNERTQFICILNRVRENKTLVKRQNQMQRIDQFIHTSTDHHMFLFRLSKQKKKQKQNK